MKAPRRASDKRASSPAWGDSELIGRAAVVTVVFVPLKEFITPTSAQSFTVTAGANMFVDFNEEIQVDYSGFAGQ